MVPAESMLKTCCGGALHSRKSVGGKIRDDFESFKEGPDWLPISSDWNHRLGWIRLVLGVPPNSGMGVMDSPPAL